MPAPAKQAPGLTGNQLKLFAMAAMTADHVGLLLLPQFPLLRILGRLSLPIFAYMIAEGCRYTHDRKRYLLRLLIIALPCQLVYLFAMRSWYQCIFVTFFLSVCLIWSLDNAQTKKDTASATAALGVLTGIAFACICLPRLLPGFYIDYGFFGILLPAGAYFGKTKAQRLLYFTLCLFLLSWELGGLQWYSLLTLPLLALYNSRRGKYRIGTFFYLYYPIHLVVIYGISLLMP